MTSPTRRKIAVGIDGSDSSAAALRWACSLANDDHGSVSALIAWNYPTAVLMPVVGTPVLPGDYAVETSRNTLGKVVEDLPTTTVSVEQSIVMGAARAVLTEASENHDLLVLGRTGNSRLKQIFLGSTVSYCVRHAECPVVVVRDSIEPERSITVAVDGSASSIEALVWALELGPEHDVLALYSHDEWELDDMALDDRFRADLDARADEMLVKSIETAIERTGADAGRVKRQVLQGDPRTTLVDQADPNTLLVLGTQGYSGIARWVLGSLTDYAVQHALGTVVIWR